MMASEAGHCESPREGPAWLAPLLQSEFFGHCKKHTTGKHEKNQFCLDCCSGPYCPEGLTQSHAGHAAVQIRKASHRDVVRIVDIQKHLDIANIQAYTINSAKIVFLQSRPQPKVCKGAARYCDTCHRSLADQVRFCSINCKLVAILESDPTDLSLSLSLADNFGSPGHSGSRVAPSVSDGHDGESVACKADSGPDTTSFSPSTPRKSNSKVAGKRKSGGGAGKLRVEVFSTGSAGAKRRKTSADGSEDTYPLSPMSVLAPGPFAHEWAVDFQGPSTPDSHETSSPRVHPRKQFHPHRAPFF